MESMEKLKKPFIHSECFIKVEGNGKTKQSEVKEWKFNENGEDLRFVTTEGWVVDCKEIEIQMGSEILGHDEILSIARSYREAEVRKQLDDTQANVETNKFHEEGIVISECSNLGPFTLNESTNNKVQIGDVAIIHQPENESSQCIVRWTGLHKGIWRALVEYIENSKKTWGDEEGIFDKQRLWHPDNGKFCKLVSIDVLERTSPPRSLNAEITTKQLLCRHLGCKARIPVEGDNLHGRVIWTGYINKVECVLVETTSFLSDDRLSPLFSINPAADIYPSFLLLNDTKSLYLVSPSKVVICDEECQLKDSVQVQNPPSPQSHAQHSQQGMTTVWGQPTTSRKYELCSSSDLKLDALGDTILVKLFSGQYKGILCWIGTRRDEWFAGVEIDKKSGVPQHVSTNGMFDGQRLWYKFRPDFLCFLVPLEEKDLRNLFSKLFCKTSRIFLSPELSETSFHLGEHVKFDQRDDIGCVVWTGRYVNQDWAVIKLAMDTSKTNLWNNRFEPKELVKCDTLPGFYAKMLFVPINKLIHLSSQLHIPMIEDVVNDHINTHERVQCKNGSLVTGLVKWCGHIDGSILQYGIQMKLQPPEEYRPHVLVLSYLVSSIKWIDRNAFWIVPHTKVIQKYEVRTLHTTDYTYLRLVGIGKAVKVELSPSVTLNGNVSWRGYVGKELMVAVQTNEPIPIEYIYPGLATQLELPTHYTLFVPPSSVHETTMHSPQFPTNNTRKEQRSPPKTRKLEIFNGIRYEREFFEQLKPLNSSEAGLDFKEHYLIEVELDPPKGKRPGICRYMGINNNGDYFIGVELLEKTFEGGTDGTFPDERGVQLFNSAEKCGIIVALERIRPVNFTIPLAPNSPFADCKSQKCVKVWCDVPHSYEFFASLRVAEKLPERMTYPMNSRVEVNINEGYYKPSGVCKWFGVDHSGTKYYVGVALDEPIVCEGTTDGKFCGLRLLSCKSHCGVILPSKRVKLHRDVVRDMINSLFQKEQLPVSLPAIPTVKVDNTDITKFVENAGSFTFCDIPTNGDKFLEALVIGGDVCIDGTYFIDNQSRHGRVLWLGMGKQSGIYFAVVEVTELDILCVDEKAYSTTGYWNEQRLVLNRNNQSCVLLVPIHCLVEELLDNVGRSIFKMSIGDIVRTDYEEFQLFGLVQELNRKPPFDVKVKVLDAIGPEPDNMNELRNNSIWVKNIRDFQVFARKRAVKFIPDEYVISPTLNYKKKMKYVDEMRNEWSGVVKWIGVIDIKYFDNVFSQDGGTWFVGMEVDASYVCPIITQCPVMRVLLEPISKGKTPIFVPVELVVPDK